ncbi:hypothetical protein FF36_03581 [Frankia torreyi]|uniref:Uncharacterized protein n=1 Tax=Frankia torreyi TaxID=1856 RepID=A0A0D8BDU5_9ACTN|nr:hypothetical protein FF36_03581 [Frankia torreyi]KQM04243.1 hypothetical protein FF86_102816 [Frankia sp. CpI1-P]
MLTDILTEFSTDLPQASLRTLLQSYSHADALADRISHVTTDLSTGIACRGAWSVLRSGWSLVLRRFSLGPDILRHTISLS